MQTLETTPIVTPEGYFISNVKLTAAGRAKFEQAFTYWYRGGYVNDVIERNSDESTWEYAHVSLADWISEIEGDATIMEMAPACRIGNEEIHFLRDVDYIVEMRSFEADKLAMLAEQLNALHDTMQAEMDRLGW